MVGVKEERAPTDYSPNALKEETGMATSSCIFCEIVAGRAPSTKIYEVRM